MLMSELPSPSLIPTKVKLRPKTNTEESREQLPLYYFEVFLYLLFEFRKRLAIAILYG